MKTLRPVYCIVVVFTLGILCGSLGTHLFYKFRMETIVNPRGPDREDRIVNRLDRKLGLDAGQKVQVRAIVHETQEGIREVRSRFRPQMMAIIENAETKIGAVLTPEQRKIYNQMIVERKEKFKRRGE
jgi:hypothetical protein